jgi:predicted nucleic acid-binding protein
MSSFVTDTQALVRFMMGRKVINDAAHQAYLSADQGEAVIIIPAIVLMEVMYLFEKNRIEIGILQTEDLMESQNYQFEPLSLEILKAASQIHDIGELHDRLIAATAMHLDLPLITNDPVIMNSEFVEIVE